jgi:hypothetical protein
MIIGGGSGDIRKSVEMFNWKTLAQCRMPGETFKKASLLLQKPQNALAYLVRL